MCSQGFAENTDSAEIDRATSSGPEDDSSQPSGWQPSSKVQQRLVNIISVMIVLI